MTLLLLVKDILIVFMTIPFKALNKNQNKIEYYFGKEFLLKSYNDTLSLCEVVEANNMLSKLVYGRYMYDLIVNRKLDQIEELHSKFYKSMCFFDYESYFDLNKLGVILVRPEVFEDRDKYSDFLKKIGLEIIYEKKLRLSFEKYWILYHEQMMEGLKNDDPLTDFASRTFNYIQNDCYIYVVKSNEKINLNAESIAEHLFRYKGKQGCDIPNTLRGDIAYNALKPYTIDGTSLKKYANIALDPIGMYRMLVRGQIYSDRCHEQADSPILFYGGQAVHIPNRNELNKDLNMFLTPEDIGTLMLKIKRKF